jgi:hypothetical protein
MKNNEGRKGIFLLVVWIYSCCRRRGKTSNEDRNSKSEIPLKLLLY